MSLLITAVILTKNEERNIGKCLRSVSWCDEVIVVDDNSIDRTCEIAKKNKALIYSRPLNNDFSSQRNFGLSKAKNDWVLFVDSDEIISDALAYEISNAVELKDRDLSDFDGFYIKRVDSIWGKKLNHGETENAWFLRLAKKTKGQWKGKVHEKWVIRGRIGNLKNSIVHYPHQSLTEFLHDINFYTTLRSQELYEAKVKANMISVIIYPLGKFIVNYFIKRGFLDGVAGLIHALLMSLHSFLVRGKLWLMWNK